MTMEQRAAHPLIDKQDIENFVYSEVRLIDEQRLDEWVDLFTGDALYWVPANKDTVDTSSEVSLILDNRQHLIERTWRLTSGLAHTTDPVSRTRHFISNVEVTESMGDEVEVRCNMVIFRLRRGLQDTIVGHCIYRLRWVDGDWRIAFKKVELLDNSGPIRSLQFML